MNMLKDYTNFAWGFSCILVGVALEFIGQAAIRGGTWFMDAATDVLEYALQVSEWD
jgi:hypothetical protein